MKEEIRELLNDRQYEAVTTIDGPVLVIAGAGSGKTRVIEFRVGYLVEAGVSPPSILLLTFTRRSAHEMISRAAKQDPRCSGVDGGTFHSFANKVLRTYSQYFGLPTSFTIYDEADAEEAIHRCAVRLGFYSRKKRFPRKDMLRAILSMALNKEVGIEDVLAKHYPTFGEYTEDIRRLREKYTEYKIASHCLDYDDLLLYLKLLLQNEQIRTQLAERYRYIMVDEFQDTNAMQGEITYSLAEGHKNVLVVGDDAQSIYSFRGSSHENIMKFPVMFPDCRIIKLEENYRSTQAILDVGNALLDNMQNRYEKCLRAVKKEKGEKPHLIHFRDAYEEAGWVADRVKALFDEGVELPHQCILFRSAYITIPLQAELSKRNVPFTVYGGLKFYETAHVKDVIAHLRLFVNPKDELAWNRVLLLVNGVGPKTAEKLLEEIAPCTTLESILHDVIEKHAQGHSYSEGLSRLANFITKAQGTTSAGERCQTVVDYYDPILREKFDIDWYLRKNDLEALTQVAGRYTSLRDLLVDLAIEPPERGVKDFHDTIWERPLILSTIHSAKGLEWRYVFLIGAIDGVMPSSYATHDDEELEEEHRMFYVAVTRAKEQLYILLHHEGRNNGIHTFNRLSRFVDAPNVRACLNESYTFSPGTGAEPDAAEGAISGYGNADLLAKLLGSMK
jgi:DNA helicase-2/ATP-dependent DNA helicase PcrA